MLARHELKRGDSVFVALRHAPDCAGNQAGDPRRVFRKTSTPAAGATKRSTTFPTCRRDLQPDAATEEACARQYGFVPSSRLSVTLSQGA